MNIFVLDMDIQRCAEFHCDQHVVKMILESAQMLCTTLHSIGQDAPYKPVHQKHPCTLWAGTSLDNFQWLKQLALALNDEFRFRFDHDHDHKSATVIRSLEQPFLPSLGLTPFAQAMPDTYKHDDPVTAYRLYYLMDKRFAKWSKRPVPIWYA